MNHIPRFLLEVSLIYAQTGIDDPQDKALVDDPDSRAKLFDPKVGIGRIASYVAVIRIRGHPAPTSLILKPSM